MLGNKNYDGSTYSATENMASWGIPSVHQIRDEMLDINTFVNMKNDNYDNLNQDFKVTKDGIATTSKKNLAKYNRDSYTKCEFLNKRSLIELGIEYKSITDIKNQHKASRLQQASVFTERKKLRNCVKHHLKEQLLACEKMTTRTIINNMRLRFDPKLVTFNIDDQTNEIQYVFNDF